MGNEISKDSPRIILTEADGAAERLRRDTFSNFEFDPFTGKNEGRLVAPKAKRPTTEAGFEGLRKRQLEDGNWKGAKDTLFKLRDLRQAAHGDMSEQVGQTYSELGDVCVKSGNYREARGHYQSAQSRAIANEGRNSFEANRLGLAIAKTDSLTGDPASAAEGFKKSLAALDRLNRDDLSPKKKLQIADGHSDYAGVLRGLGRADEAAAEQASADRIREGIKGKKEQNPLQKDPEMLKEFEEKELDRPLGKPVPDKP